jgi:hypothetical protein
VQRFQGGLVFKAHILCVSLISRLESDKEESEVWTRPPTGEALPRERDFFIDNLLVRIHFIIVMIRWTGLAPWGVKFFFQGSLTSTVPYPERETPIV